MVDDFHCRLIPKPVVWPDKVRLTGLVPQATAGPEMVPAEGVPEQGMTQVLDKVKAPDADPNPVTNT